MDSKVSDPEIGRGPKGLVVTIHVFEGRQYRVGKVRFSGDSGLSEEGQRKAVKLKEGDVFSRETLLSDVLSLTTAMNDKGYALAIVSPLVEKRKEYPLADVMYKAEKGDKFRFGKVEVLGNTKTLDRVIRRNLDVADGMTYTATGLKKSKENLTRLSYFKDVKISTEPSTVPREMDVKVEVQEGPTGTLSGGLGFSTVDKIFGVVQLTENNLFGRGWKASLNSQFGSRRTLFSLDFRDPYFLDSDFSLLLNAYNLRTNYTDFERKSTGGKIGFGYSLDRNTTASLAFRLDDVEIIDPRACRFPDPAERVRQGEATDPESHVQPVAEHHGQVYRPFARIRRIRDGGIRGGSPGGRLGLREIFPEHEGIFPGHKIDRHFRELSMGAHDQYGGGDGPALRTLLPGGSLQHPGLQSPDHLPGRPEHRRRDRRKQGTGGERGIYFPHLRRVRVEGGLFFRHGEYLGTGAVAVGYEAVGRTFRPVCGRDGHSLVLPDGSPADRMGVEPEPRTR